MLDCHFNVFLRRAEQKREEQEEVGDDDVRWRRHQHSSREAPTLILGERRRGMVASAKLRSTLLLNYEDRHDDDET